VTLLAQQKLPGLVDDGHGSCQATRLGVHLRDLNQCGGFVQLYDQPTPFRKRNILPEEIDYPDRAIDQPTSSN
jgi:hypothetical protein